MAMVVGVCRLLFTLPGNDSLKGKRAVVRRIVERARHRFNVAAAEVDDHDLHRRLTLGFAVVSNDSSHVNSMLDTITSFAVGISEAQLIDRSIEIIPIGSMFSAEELP
jgi:hypothetical protein